MAKKEKEEAKQAKAKEEEVPDEGFDEEEEGFGGLPERDLKKNLGCG